LSRFVPSRRRTKVRPSLSGRAGTERRADRVGRTPPAEPFGMMRR
jgi:hypothetical protein